MGRLRRRRKAREVPIKPQDSSAPIAVAEKDAMDDEPLSTLAEPGVGGSSLSDMPEETPASEKKKTGTSRELTALARPDPLPCPKAPVEPSSTEIMAAWIRSLRLHQKLYFYATVFSVLSFSATRNWNMLRILPCIPVVEIGRNLLIWIIFVTDTAEAQLVRDLFIMLGGRVKTEVERTREGGFFRRRYEAVVLGGANQFTGTAWGFWSGYCDNIQEHAKERRAAATDDFLNALQNNPFKKD
mmetsp:Transcript_9977/g.16532  ORF Transcript_9977/g.16532 Transcript_9977/m.16532 type:complete len:242 (-) Transcript_9977:125-850(-)|eukprot:CAMPEP_0197720324 /NCGR_PEP_ID=MMETSP1434-20131217/3724_1 /TAXON_ID=265543 /ORGANISM="Minutocellus polymorphus, Strain CCMP3303" /LENGTH=241 /DNA_ID=CAMNT_0043305169 /DNA_START=111 /DNA_END=836 /DNA_ORIENTATION=+